MAAMSPNSGPATDYPTGSRIEGSSFSGLSAGALAVDFTAHLNREEGPVHWRDRDDAKLRSRVSLDRHRAGTRPATSLMLLWNNNGDAWSEARKLL